MTRSVVRICRDGQFRTTERVFDRRLHRRPDFQADIQALAASGITRGCNSPVNDPFCPADPVTRGQMAAFLGR